MLKHNNDAVTNTLKINSIDLFFNKLVIHRAKI